MGRSRGGGPLSIVIGLRRLDDLFASLDPSPLVERDIDNAVEEFIVESAIDAPKDCPFALEIRLAEPPSADTGTVEAAIRHYFGFMEERESRRLRHMGREGRQALALGLLFLAACTALGQTASTLIGGAVGAFLREGLLIIGWVANWRPISIFLYDWRPLARRRRVYQRLAAATVTFRQAAPPVAPPPAHG